ncbi:UNVERIFIED_CONTAM: hypothetical protein HDU68_001642 [Siphonaria sp. JEL0065]|nr:hypothetical protein HDU68_001642 [Siphonaria sp. JEL0065]
MQKVIEKVASQWTRLVTENVLVHPKTGGKVYVIGTSLLSLPDTYAGTTTVIKALNPSFIAVDNSSEAIGSWLPKYAWFLNQNALPTDLTASKEWAAKHQPEISATGVPLPYIHASIKAGFFPSLYDAAAVSVWKDLKLKPAIESLQHNDLLEAEKMARTAADVRARREADNTVVIPKSSDSFIESQQEQQPQPQDSLKEANMQLQSRLSTLFDTYGITPQLLLSLRTGESPLVDTEIQGLLMGPELQRAYTKTVSDWVQEFPSATQRFGVFEMIRKAKVETIVGKLNVLCVKNLANGSRGPVVGLVERKLVASVLDQFVASHERK